MNILTIGMVVFALVVLIFVYMKFFKKNFQDLTVTVKKIKLKSDSDETEGYGIETFAETSKLNVSLEVTFETSGGWELKGIDEITVTWGDDSSAPSASVQPRDGIKDFTEYKAVLQLSDFSDNSLKANDINGKTIGMTYIDGDTVRNLDTITLANDTFSDEDFDTLISTGNISTNVQYQVGLQDTAYTANPIKGEKTTYTLENLLGLKITTTFLRGTIDENKIRFPNWADIPIANEYDIKKIGSRYVFVNGQGDTRKILSLKDGLISEIPVTAMLGTQETYKSVQFTITQGQGDGDTQCSAFDSDILQCPTTCVTLDNKCVTNIPNNRNPYVLTSADNAWLNSYKSDMFLLEMEWDNPQQKVASKRKFKECITKFKEYDCIHRNYNSQLDSNIDQDTYNQNPRTFKHLSKLREYVKQNQEELNNFDHNATYESPPDYNGTLTMEVL